MYSIRCPVCNQTTFSPEDEPFDTCFNCGTVFSGKYGRSKRRKERVKKGSRLTIPFKGKSYEAQTIDISDNGVSVRIPGNPEVAIGDMLEFFLGSQQVQTKVVRIQRFPDRIVIGLERLD